MVVNAFPESTKVESFNGRTGNVMPTTGDYTAEMVGARPSTWVPTQADIQGAVITIIGTKIKGGTTALNSGTSSLETGAIYVQYE